MQSIIHHVAEMPVTISNGTFLLLLIIGGGRVAAFKHWHRARADYAVFCDVPEELEKLRRSIDSIENIAFFPLGLGETADTLAQIASLEVQNRIRRLGSMNATTGLGQVPTIGHMSATKLTQSDAFKVFVRFLLDEVIVRTKGRPTSISVRVMGSTAGATASGAAELIAETTVAALTPLGVPVDLNLDFIDATTFSGLGDRTGRNSAATICELSAHCLTKGGLPLDRVTRRMDLLALPPFRHEKGTRDEFIALDEQAITCSEMSAFLNVVRPNHALDGALGTILYRQVDYFRQLARESEVANEVAHIYAPMLANAIGSAVVARELVTGLFTDARSAPLIRETVDNIVEDVQSTTDEDLLRAIERPGEHIECSASVETASGEKLALETVDEYFLQPAVTLTDAVRRLSLLRTLHALAVQELANVVAILGENAETLANQRKSVVKLATRIHSGLWFWNNDKKLRGLILQAAQLLRSTADNTLHLEAVKLSLERAVAAIASTLQLNESHLLGIQSALESFRPRGKPLPGVGSLVVADLDRAFRELSPIVSKPRDRQIDILCAQVVRVTVAGLARIVEVPEPRLELIVDRIVNGPVRHHGPYIGSTCHPEGSQLVIVLPPLMPAVAEEIKGMLNSVEPKAVVVFTDFAAAGVNVMRYRFFRPKTVAQLFPGVLARDLEAARNDENKHLFFPHGDQRLNDLGISAAS